MEVCGEHKARGAGSVIKHTQDMTVRPLTWSELLRKKGER